MMMPYQSLFITLALFWQLLNVQTYAFLERSASISPRCSVLPRSSAIRFQAIAEHQVYEDADAVGQALCSYITSSAKSAIEAKNSFHLCIPGGSAVKLLRYLQQHQGDLDWSKVSVFYVNHKCVSNDDKLATHLKAKNMFLDALQGVRVFAPDDTIATCNGRAQAYETALKATLPLKEGLPCFDLVVLGMGKDGHIGSLYPGRKEVNEDRAFVVTVDKVRIFSRLIHYEGFMASIHAERSSINDHHAAGLQQR